MILFRRIIPFLAVLGTAFLLELVLIRQDLFWVILPLLAVIAVLPVGMLAGWRPRSLDFWNFLITPVALIGSTFFFFLFLNAAVFAHLTIAVTAMMFGWFCENLFLFYWRPAHYQPHALENIALYANLLSVFFLYASLYAARIFLAVPFALIGILGACFSMILSFQMLVTSKIRPAASLWLWVALSLILTEMFFVVVILPTTFPVAGFLLVIPYYLVTSFTRHAFRKTLTPRVVLRNAALGVFTLSITVATAPWS